MPIVKRFDVGKYIGIVYQMEKWSEHHNGYVVLPKGHPSEGKDYDAINMSVHGGLTFGTKIGKDRHWLPADLVKEAKGRWMYGFDCAHYQDAQFPQDHPKTIEKVERFPSMGKEHYWTADEVEAEVREMITQFQRKRKSRRK